jgi:hypothetical protein
MAQYHLRYVPMKKSKKELPVQDEDLLAIKTLQEAARRKNSVNKDQFHKKTILDILKTEVEKKDSHPPPQRTLQLRRPS